MISNQKLNFHPNSQKNTHKKTRIFWPSVLTEPRPCEHGGGLPLHLLCPLLLLDEHLIPPDSVLVVGGEAGEDKVEDRGRTGEGGTHWGQRTGDREDTLDLKDPHTKQCIKQGAASHGPMKTILSTLSISLPSLHLSIPQSNVQSRKQYKNGKRQQL